VFAAMRPALGIQLLIIGGVGAIGALATLAMHVARGPWWIAATIALRFIDLLVWAGRYAVVFAIVGHPITVAAAMALAVLCQIAMLVPLVGNGLGLREWAVGAVAGILPEDLVSSSGTLTTTIGLAADLANRAAELVTAVPVGLLCAHSLARRTSGRVVT
jgi:hypothetical protein